MSVFTGLVQALSFFISVMNSPSKGAVQHHAMVLNRTNYKGEEPIKEPYTDDELTVLLHKLNTGQCSFTEYRSRVIVSIGENMVNQPRIRKNVFRRRSMGDGNYAGTQPMITS